MSIELLAEKLVDSKKTCAFTGAGISVASGIPDFRSRGGLWDEYPPEKYGTIEAFIERPEEVWEFFLAVFDTLKDAKPSKGHISLAEMEQFDCLNHVITQNIDGLHQAAGSSRVTELHGSLDGMECLKCGYLAEQIDKVLNEASLCPKCNAFLKPSVVLFGEILPQDSYEEAIQVAKSCDACLIIGTSSMVAPASWIPDIILNNGGKLFEINVQCPDFDRLNNIDIFIEGQCDEVLPALNSAVNKLM
tara:strand:- start:1318 stop:2058 length:741 start_codon:yes stop_codon:yes gene_type:complete